MFFFLSCVPRCRPPQNSLKSGDLPKSAKADGHCKNFFWYVRIGDTRDHLRPFSYLQTVDYTIERLTGSHIPALAELYRLSFGKKISRDFLYNKYDTANLGVQHVGFVAVHQNTVAAFYGVIPCVVVLEGQELLAAQSADTMTHPAHRNKGLFVTLATKTYALAKELNIRFLFGFPNQHSQHGAIKLGWDFSLPPMKFFQITLRSLPYVRPVFRSHLLSRAYLKLVRAVLESRPANAADLFSEQDNGVRHDAAFLAYKEYSPSFFITVSGAPVWVRLDGDMKIGFLRIDPDTDPNPLLKKLKRLAALLGCGRVVFITSHNTNLCKTLLPRVQASDAFPAGIFKLTEENLRYDLIRFEYCDLDIF